MPHRLLCFASLVMKNCGSSATFGFLALIVAFSLQMSFITSTGGNLLATMLFEISGLKFFSCSLRC